MFDWYSERAFSLGVVLGSEMTREDFLATFIDLFSDAHLREECVKGQLDPTERLGRAMGVKLL
jgi:hypothetical protein